MSIEIYYFSGSGNSLHVAQELQKRLPETRLIPIVGLMNKDTLQTQGDAVGFVFPQYASSLPNVVAKFIARLDVKSASYLFAIATRGGTDCQAFEELDRLPRRMGRKLDAFFVLFMPSSSQSIIKSFPEHINAAEIARLEADMLRRLDTIQKVIAARKISRSEDLRGTVTLPPALAPLRPLLQALSPVFHWLGKRAESGFVFYSDAQCNGCGLCERVCLAQRIQMVADRPAWRMEVQCYGCFACLNFCPKQAVQIASTWYLKSYTPENGRYHHPAITAQDIARQKALIDPD